MPYATDSARIIVFCALLRKIFWNKDLRLRIPCDASQNLENKYFIRKILQNKGLRLPPSSQFISVVQAKILKIRRLEAPLISVAFVKSCQRRTYTQNIPAEGVNRQRCCPIGHLGQSCFTCGDFFLRCSAVRYARFYCELSVARVKVIRHTGTVFGCGKPILGLRGGGELSLAGGKSFYR